MRAVYSWCGIFSQVAGLVSLIQRGEPGWPCLFMLYAIYFQKAAEAESHE